MPSAITDWVSSATGGAGCESGVVDPPPTKRQKSSSEQGSSSRAVAVGTTSTELKCAAGYLCEAPDGAVLESSTHRCFYCSKKIHCAMWCGKSWTDVLKTTSITLGSLSQGGREIVEMNGDHEKLTMCHLCIRVSILDSVAKMSTASSGNGDDNMIDGDDGEDEDYDGDEDYDDDDVNDDDDDDVDVDDNDDESNGGRDKSGKVEWKLLPPPDSKSVWWRNYMRFDPQHHPNKLLKAVCNLCKSKGKHKEISIKAKGTTGMKRHLQSGHLKIYDELKREEAKAKAAKGKVTTKISSIFKAKNLTADAKHLYKKAVTSCIIDNALPISIVESDSFRSMFAPLNKDAHKIVNIVNIAATAVRDEVLDLGRYAQQATIKEMTGKKVALTSDHWTGKNQLTSHFITELWEMESVLLDFKLFEGRTTGELIFNDITSVLDQFKGVGDGSVLVHTVNSDDFPVYRDTEDVNATPTKQHLDTILITDTTGNMGKLGEYLRKNDQEHGYCFAHLMHLTAGIAFDRKSSTDYSILLNISL